MNEKKLLVFIAASFLAAAPFLHGQDLVAFPTGDASWSVVVSPEKSGSGTASTTPNGGASLRVTQATVTQLNKVKRIQLTWSDGSQSEKWTIPGLPVTFWQDPRNGLVRARQNGTEIDLASNMSLTYDSFAFGWITPQCLQEKDPITYMDTQCYHYVGSVVSPVSDAKNPPKFKREAWIDAKTLHPVALDNGDSISTYTFPVKPPTGPLTPPPAFQKEIAYYKAIMGEQ